MAQRFFVPNAQMFNDSGIVLNAGKLYFYETGTSTPLDTYSDEDLTSANANPVVADSAGRFGDIFLKNQKYKVVLKDSTDATIWTADPVSNTDKIGKQTIFIPATAMTATASNPAGGASVTETTSGRPDILSFDYDATTAEFTQFQIAMPKSWDEGTMTAQFYWTHIAAGTAWGVTWDIEGVAVSNDDTIDVAYGTTVSVSDTGGTAEDMYISAETGAITLGGSPAESDMAYFRVGRDPADGSDTMDVDANLIGIKLIYTTDSGTDD